MPAKRMTVPRHGTTGFWQGTTILSKKPVVPRKKMTVPRHGTVEKPLKMSELAKNSHFQAAGGVGAGAGLA